MNYYHFIPSQSGQHDFYGLQLHQKQKMTENSVSFWPRKSICQIFGYTSFDCSLFWEKKITHSILYYQPCYKNMYILILRKWVAIYINIYTLLFPKLIGDN